MDLVSPLPWQAKRPLTEAQEEVEAEGFLRIMALGGEI